MSVKHEVIVDNIPVPIENETNLLELLRKANVDIPTFCYHSELSVYGACRLCLVDVEGRGLVASCSTTPSDGMVIRTNTNELREMRKITIELLLANHHNACTTCDKSSACKLRELADRFGVHEIRFKPRQINLPLDTSSDSLVRDPNKCVLCGDCVRYCKEIQSVGAIDFAYRGKDTVVLPAFGNELAHVECVNCGQCASVCPTGAIIPKSEIDIVWQYLADPTKQVIVQIAPAVRVALGEDFNLPLGQDNTGKIVAALKRLGFNQVFDTCFAADLTVVEEANEFLARKQANQKLPLFTSCCPAWVKFTEQYYPELLPNLSSCRSPQQMFGSLAKAKLAQELQIDKRNLIVVSIMPCTAKKYEAKRPEFQTEGIKDVDAVLTTQELAKMIKEAGILFPQLRPLPMDLPFGFATGAGVIFGNSGGVSEAVLRYAYKNSTGNELKPVDFVSKQISDGLTEIEIGLGDNKLRLAIVHGLRNARKLVESILNKTAKYDLIEVMACPGGCIGGAGQPLPNTKTIRMERTQGLKDVDQSIVIHTAQDNPYIQQCYSELLQNPNSKVAHELLHTVYTPKKRLEGEGIELKAARNALVSVKICVGTSCYLNGSQQLIAELIEYLESHDLSGNVSVSATFCLEKCGSGPNALVNQQSVEHATLDKIVKVIGHELTEKMKILS